MEHFHETPGGLLFAANGFDRPLKWDGLTEQMEPVGVVAPTTAPTLAGSGTGSIVGTYTAYLRFVGKDGNYSNLSPISSSYSAAGNTGTVTGATNATPIVVTSLAHGLTTGNLVKVEDVGGNTTANGTWTITVINANSFSLDDTSGTDTYTGGGTWTSGVGTITYTNVQTPTEQNVTRRQILRNTDGQAQTYYVDVDTGDLSGSSFSSTRSDATLAVQEAQAILDSTGGILANRRGLPPSHKQVFAAHLDRMFQAVQEDYSRGSAKTTFGSATVTGVGTDWTSQMAGRLLYVVGAPAPYEISSVNTTTQVVTLTANYQGPTDKFAVYAIRPDPGERRTVYFSGAGEPESWLATDGMTIQEDDDEITGLMQRGSFLYVIERRHIHKITFQEDPKKDGALFLSANRGCINQRCWIAVDDVAYMLDELGVHKFSGNAQTESVSDTIQEIFRPATSSSTRVQWRASKWFHACLYRPQETIRWFVTLAGVGRPRHALCYNYRLSRWWIEEFPIPIGASAAGRISKSPFVFLGGQHQKVYAMWTGFTDMANATAGTLRGTATGATAWSLTDSSASFASSYVNAPIAIVEGKGRGQWRKIVAVTSTSVTVKDPWLDLPDTTSVYQIGGVTWNWKSAWMRFADNESLVDRRLEVVYSPTAEAAKMDVRLRHNFAAAATAQGVTMTSAAGNKVSSTKDEADLVVNVAGTETPGFVQKRIPGHRTGFIDGKRFVQVEAGGTANNEEEAVYSVIVEGVSR